MKKLLYLGVLLALAGAICWPVGSSTPQGGSDPVLIGAGDIADGFNLNLASSMATAALLDATQPPPCLPRAISPTTTAQMETSPSPMTPPGDGLAPAPFL